MTLIYMILAVTIMAIQADNQPKKFDCFPDKNCGTHKPKEPHFKRSR